MTEQLRKSTRKRKSTYLEINEDYEDLPVKTTKKRTTRSKTKMLASKTPKTKTNSVDVSENSEPSEKSNDQEQIKPNKRGKSLPNTRKLTKKKKRTKSYDDEEDPIDMEQSDPLVDNELVSDDFDISANSSVNDVKQPNKRNLTSRQRAMIERQQQIENGEAVPYFNEFDNVDDQSTKPKKSTKSAKNTEEEKIRKKIKNQQRIQRKQEQLQESKMNVINKLLYKNTSSNRNDNKNSTRIGSYDHVRYCNNLSETTLSYTANINYPLTARKSDNV